MKVLFAQMVTSVVLVTVFSNPTLSQQLDFQESLPEKVIAYVSLPDLDKSLDDFSQMDLKKLINKTPLGRIAGEISKSLLSDEDNPIGEDDSELLILLEEVLDGDLKAALFRKSDGTFGFAMEVGVDDQHWLIASILKKLLTTHPNFKLVKKEDVEFWQYQKTSCVSIASKRLLVADSIETLEELHNRSLIEPESKRRFAMNRKWQRIVEQFEDLNDSNGILFVDSGVLTNMAIAAQPDMRGLANETGLLDALAFGARVTLNQENADWELQMLLLCAKPRTGIWSALCLNPLDSNAIAGAPENVDYAFIANSDIDKLTAAISCWKEFAKEKGMSEDEFFSWVADVAPPLVVPAMLGDTIKELFDGRIILYGRDLITQNSWNSDFSIGLGYQDSQQAKIKALIDKLVGSDDPLVERNVETGNYWLEGNRSYLTLVESVKDLNLKDLPRTSFCFENNHLARFNSEQLCLESLKATYEKGGLENDAQFEQVIQFVNERFSKKPAAFGFIRSGAVLKKIYYRQIGPGSKLRNHYWTADIERLQPTEAKTIGLTAKQAILNAKDAWPSYEEITSFVGPMGLVIFDQEFGFSISIFQTKKQR